MMNGAGCHGTADSVTGILPAGHFPNVVAALAGAAAILQVVGPPSA